MKKTEHKNRIKIQNKIFLKDWHKLHPDEKPASSDMYFVDLSNVFLEMMGF